jgi:P27 family predicted phage terminase small subunit
MRGPPPTPTHLKLIRGNPGKRPIRPEPEPEIPPEVLEAPPYLVSYAADEWHRLAGELHRLKLLTVVDVHLFACYCEAYRAWRTAGEALSAMAARDPLTGGLMVKSQNGNAMQNPLFLTMRKQPKTCCGMPASSAHACRARQARSAPFGDPPSKFDGLLGG